MCWKPDDVDLRDPLIEDELPFHHDGRPVAAGEALLEIVGGHDHRAGAVSQPFQHFGEHPGGMLVESGVGLVEQQQFRIVQQSPRHRETLLHAP